MKIPKIVFFISVALNILMVAAIVDFASFKNAKVKDWKIPEKFPVVLIQKIDSELHALNLSNESVYLDNRKLAAAEIIANKVTTTRIIRTPLNISWNGKTAPFPSDFAKEAPPVTTIAEKPDCRICKNWIISEGVYEVNEMLVIPANVNFRIQPGAVLNFGENGGIFSRSAIKAESAQFRGTNWKGITILNQSDETSTMKGCIVEGGKGFEAFGMKYTGTLNFILGKIELTNMAFQNSHSEDALNVKWTTGSITKTSFKNSFSDAFDADWSELTLEELEVDGTKNDCLDFSGGKILATNLKLKGCQDKALSNGESNYLEASQVEISQSKTAIANKDGAKVVLKNGTIQFSETAFHQYHQKMFYSPPSAVFQENVKIDQVTTKHNIESGKVSGHESL